MVPNTLNTTILLIINLAILGYSLWLNKKIFKSYAFVSLPFLFIFFMFFFHALIQSYIFFSGNLVKYYSDTLNYENVTKSFIFVTLFNFFFCVGNTLYALQKKRKRIFFKHIKIYTPKKIFYIGITIFLIGFISKILYMLNLGNGNVLYFATHYYNIQLESAGKGGSFLNYLTFLFVGIEIGSNLLLINTVKNKYNKLITTLVICLSIIISFNTRLTVLKLLLQYLIIVAIFNKKIRKNLHYIAIAIFIPFMCFLVLFLGIYREQTNNKIISNIDPAFFILGSVHNMKTICDVFEHQTLFGDKKYGKSIILPVIQKPIPRKIWKNKELNAAAIWTKTMRPGALEDGFSIAPGIGFDLYINYGYTFTLLIFLALGYISFLIQQSIYKELIYRPENILIALISAILISLLLTLRGTDISSYIIAIIYYIPIIGLSFCKIKFQK